MMLQTGSQNSVQEKFCNQITLGIDKKQNLAHSFESKLSQNTVSIPDVCQHKPVSPVHDTLHHSESVSDQYPDSCHKRTLDSVDEQLELDLQSSDTEVEGCNSPSSNSSDSGELSLDEEKINQVASQARLARQNSLRLVSRSPKINRRATPIVELDRKWALDQCEVRTITN